MRRALTATTPGDTFEQLGELASAGASVGMNVVVVATRVDDLGPLTRLTGDRLVGPLTDPDDRARLDAPPIGPADRHPRRCWSTTADRRVQLATPPANVEDDDRATRARTGAPPAARHDHPGVDLMSDGVTRGDGVGIEIADTVVRGVRLRHDVEGRLSAVAEYPVNLADDNATLDALVLLRAELGEPDEPARIATFPGDAMMQRVDITGRSGPELNELRSRLDRRHGINSTVVVDDGPRRWLLLIRWDAHAVRRLEDLAERAGFVDVTVEPTPMSIARVTGHDATYVRRLVAQNDAHHAVLSHRLPVAALSTVATGRPQPDVDISTVDVPLAYFDDFMTDAALAEIMDRVDERARTKAHTDANGDRRVDHRCSTSSACRTRCTQSTTSALPSGRQPRSVPRSEQRDSPGRCGLST